MTTQIQRRRGTTAQHSTFTGAVGEVTVDTDKEVLVVHDGAQVGGYPQMRENGSNSALALGSAGTPSLKFAGDTNTGIYSPGADQVAISTGGVQRVTANTTVIDSSLPFSVYTASAGASLTGLTINNSSDNASTAARITLQPSTTFNRGCHIEAINSGASGQPCDLIFGTNPAFSTSTERLRITSTGNVGVGTSSPLALFDAKPSSNRHIVITSSASYADNGIVATNDAGGEIALGIGGTPIQFFTGATERMRLDSSGRLGIGTTSPAHKLVVSNGGVQSIEFNWDGASTNFIQSYNRSTSQYLPLSFYSSQHIFFNGANNSESGRFDSSGRLLVGTSSARTNFENSTFSAAVQVEGTDYAGSRLALIRNGGGGGINLCATGGASVGSNTAVSSSAGLGEIVFAGSDGSEFVNAASITAVVDGTPGANDMPGRLVFSTTADGASSPTERMRIDNQGRILTYNANTGNNSFTVESAAAAGTAVANFVGSYGSTGVNTGTSSFIVWTNGNVVNTNNSYGAISDLKLKENIVDASSQWDDIKALQVRKYNFKEGQTHTQIGLIAQEAELISPGLVSESTDRDADGNDLGTVTKSVNYSVLYMKAVKALQEAMERIETLEAKVAALESA